MENLCKTTLWGRNRILMNVYIVLSDVLHEIDRIRAEGYHLSITTVSPVYNPVYEILARYHAHTCCICRSLKLHGSFNACMRNKNSLLEKAPTEPYYGCCYAGIEEYVYPVMEEDTHLCYLHISGFCGNTEHSKKVIEQYLHRCGEEKDLCRSDLSTTPPKKEDAVRLVTPLSYILRALYDACSSIHVEESNTDRIYREAISMMYDSFRLPLSVNEIAGKVGYSSSYLRMIFQKKTGKGILATLREIRLKEAARLLTESGMTVTEIAMQCGFCDAACFSNDFKKFYGVSPKRYRQQQ